MGSIVAFPILIILFCVGITNIVFALLLLVIRLLSLKQKHPKIIWIYIALLIALGFAFMTPSIWIGGKIVQQFNHMESSWSACLL